MSGTTIPSSFVVVSEGPSRLSPLLPPSKIPCQPIGNRRKPSSELRKSKPSPLRSEIDIRSGCKDSDPMGEKVQRGAFIFPKTSSAHPLSTSSITCLALPTSESPGAHHTEQEKLGHPRPLEQGAKTSPRTSRTKLLFNSLAFFALKRYSSDDSSGLLASEAAPLRLSAVGWSAERGCLVTHDPAECMEVRRLDAKHTMPVQSGTTAVDVIDFAATFPIPVDKTTTVIWECLKTPGIERPLRRYERVCNKRVAWGQDHQNWLRVDDSGEQKVVTTLPIKDFRGDSSFLLFHSSHPKVWVERWVTVRANGQVVASNRAGYDPGKTTLLCHLADFDIYSPVGGQKRHRLKSPGKFWVVLKRQRNFDLATIRDDLHYFSTDDKELTNRFYEFVYRRRGDFLLKGNCDGS